MKDHSTPPHPGPFRIAKAGGEAAALIVAVGFVAMGLAGLPIAKFFLLGAILIGAAVAIFIRWRRRKPLFPNRFL